jgi:mannose-6-phosphate isomerase-like protein (cupin superfamily)
MAKRFTIHEDEVEAKELPGRKHKMMIGPADFGQASNMCMGVATFPPRTHAPPHLHPKEEEILYVLAGKGEMYFDGVPEGIYPGICIYVPPNVEHSINNTGNEPLKVLYVFSPPVTQGSYDKVRTEK